METREILKRLRESHQLTQEQMAERLMVTRQETLKLLSREFHVSVNTLLGAPRQLICQCCGMPLNEDDSISREADGSYNEDYCKWCYANGEFAYQTKQALLDFLLRHMPAPKDGTEEERRCQFDLYLSQLKHWK